MECLRSSLLANVTAKSFTSPRPFQSVSVQRSPRLRRYTLRISATNGYSVPALNLAADVATTPFGGGEVTSNFFKRGDWDFGIGAVALVAFLAKVGAISAFAKGDIPLPHTYDYVTFRWSPYSVLTAQRGMHSRDWPKSQTLCGYVSWPCFLGYSQGLRIWRPTPEVER